MSGAPHLWATARGRLSLDRPRIVGIVNVTPDSFWSGGRHDGLEAAVTAAEQHLEEGADLLDLGGESTRPGTTRVPVREELDRVVPVLRELVRRWPDLLVSVDTTRAEVAEVVLAEGAAVINDVSGLRLDPEMGAVIERWGAGSILMHSRGGVEEMATYDLAEYGPDPVGEIVSELGWTVERAESCGIQSETIVIDPGLGFAKRTRESLATLAELDRVLELGYPILVGPSRKRFIGEVAGGLQPEDRLEGTIAASVAAYLRGARLFRVHDTQPVRRALAVAEAIERYS